MARTLRLIFTLIVALIGGLLIAPPAHAAGTNTVVFHATDPDGGPIAITAWIHTGGNGSGNNSATGDLTWNNVDDGDYTFAVTAESMDGYRLWYDGSPSGSTTQPTPTHLAGGQTLTITLQFPRLATLSGLVTTSDGDPVANLDVLINRGGSIKSTKTNAAGTYNFGYLRSGSVTIGTQSSGVWVGAPMESLTIAASGSQTKDFVLAPAGSIDGTLVFDRDGAPASGITVVAFTKAPTGYAGTTTTDANGHFHLGGLAATAYVLRYDDPLAGGSHPKWSGHTWDPAGATAIAVTPATTTTYDERLVYPDPAADSHTLSGTVTDTHGTPLVGIVITADDGSNPAPTTTDRNGRWALSTGDGSWTVRAESGTTLQSLETATPWYPQYYASTGTADTVAQAATVSVSGSSTTDGLTMELSRSARLGATVEAAASSEPANATWLPYSTGGAALPAAPLDMQGRPLFRAGSYKLLVSGDLNGSALLPRWYANGTSAETAQTLTFAEGDDVAGSVVSLAPDLAATSAPTVSGSATVGGSLLGTTGSWNLVTGTTYATTWTRGGTVLSSASSYQPTTADAGSTLQYSVTATNSAFGHTFTTTSTVPVTVGTVASKTSLKAKALGGKKVRFTITVTAAVRPSGTVTIRRGSTVVGTAKLAKGKATITVKRQPKGKKSYKATFNGSPQVAVGTSKTVKVKVR